MKMKEDVSVIEGDRSNLPVDSQECGIYGDSKLLKGGGDIRKTDPFSRNTRNTQSSQRAGRFVPNTRRYLADQTVSYGIFLNFSTSLMFHALGDLLRAIVSMLATRLPEVL
jgi:hypothetical protein